MTVIATGFDGGRKGTLEKLFLMVEQRGTKGNQTYSLPLLAPPIFHYLYLFDATLILRADMLILEDLPQYRWPSTLICYWLKG